MINNKLGKTIYTASKDTEFFGKPHPIEDCF